MFIAGNGETLKQVFYKLDSLLLPSAGGCQGMNRGICPVARQAAGREQGPC